MSELAIAWPRFPAPNRTMLCWPELRRILRISLDQRVDPVADPALAELAEAREVAPDLGRVDVRVLGQLLRGDRLLAHLPSLDQDLEVAREARRHAERQPVALGERQVVMASSASADSSSCFDAGPRVDHRRTVSSLARERARGVEDQLGDHLAVHLHHRNPLEVSGVEARRRARCPPRGARIRGRRGALRSPHGPRRRGGIRAGCRGRRSSRQSHPSRGIRDTATGSMNRAADAIIAALSVQSSPGTSLRRIPRSLTERGDPLAQRARSPRRPPPSATASHSPPATRPLELRDQLADDGGLVAGRQVGASLARPRPRASSRTA